MRPPRPRPWLHALLRRKTRRSGEWKGGGRTFRLPDPAESGPRGLKSVLAGHGRSRQQEINQATDAQQEEGDDRAIRHAESRFFRMVGGHDGRFDVIPALPDCKRKRTHVRFQAKRGPVGTYDRVTDSRAKIREERSLSACSSPKI